MTAFLETVGHFGHFSWKAVCQFPSAIRRPRPTLTQIAHFVSGSLALVLVVGVTVGLVTWMHLGEVLARYESKRFLPGSLMIAVVLEIGPVAVGLIASSRLAAGLAAELSAMNSTEQIDALRCLGVAPMRRLVAPRVLACLLTLPPMTILADYSALAGSYAAEWVGGELTWSLYYRRAIEQLPLTDAVLATAKTAVFGLLVGLIACYVGITAERSTESVGAAATRAVVACTLAVLIGNVFLVRLIQIVH